MISSNVWKSTVAIRFSFKMILKQVEIMMNPLIKCLEKHSEGFKYLDSI